MEQQLQSISQQIDSLMSEITGLREQFSSEHTRALLGSERFKRIYKRSFQLQGHLKLMKLELLNGHLPDKRFAQQEQAINDEIGSYLEGETLYLRLDKLEETIIAADAEQIALIAGWPPLMWVGGQQRELGIPPLAWMCIDTFIRGVLPPKAYEEYRIHGRTGTSIIYGRYNPHRRFRIAVVKKDNQEVVFIQPASWGSDAQEDSDVSE